MAGPDLCDLCEDPLTRGHDRVGGLSLCQRCFHGDVRRVAQARGWTLVSDHSEYTLRYEESDTIYQTDARITMPCEPGLELVCVRRTWVTRLAGLVRSRARSRDPLFESHVRVWTPHPPRVEGLLRGPGVEGSVMDTLGNFPASHVTLRDGLLDVHYLADDPHTEGEIVARACVLALHIERHAAATSTAAGDPFRTAGRG